MVVAIAALVVARVVIRSAPIPLGVTAAAELRPGACLSDADPEATEFEVVSCGAPHAAQVFATASLDLDEDIYAQAGAVLGDFADAVCARYLEYRLFLDPGIERADFATFAVGVPTAEEVEAGDAEARCVIVPADGGPLTADVARPAP